MQPSPRQRVGLPKGAAVTQQSGFGMFSRVLPQLQFPLQGFVHI